MNHEESFNQWKEDMRREALEKELSRLETKQIRQQKLIQMLRRLLMIFVIILLASWIGFFLFTNNQDDAYKNSSSLIEEENLPDMTQNNDSKPTLNKESLKTINPATDTVEFKIPEDGIFFSIQIGAYLGFEMDQFQTNMVSLFQESSADINQFTLGVLGSYAQALEFKELVKQIGFSDAYITAFKNGKRISLQEALNSRMEDRTDN